MAKINAIFDTKEKTLSCDIDGVSIPDVVSVSLFKDYYEESKYTVEVYTAKEKDEEGMIHMSKIVAGVTPLGEKKVASQFSDVFYVSSFHPPKLSI